MVGDEEGSKEDTQQNEPIPPRDRRRRRPISAHTPRLSSSPSGPPRTFRLVKGTQQRKDEKGRKRTRAREGDAAADSSTEERRPPVLGLSAILYVHYTKYPYKATIDFSTAYYIRSRSFPQRILTIGAVVSSGKKDATRVPATAPRRSWLVTGPPHP